VDQQGAALPGVALVVRHQESGLFRETVSGGDGSFFLSAMTPGVYEVAAELEGFKKYQRRDVRMEVGGTTQIEVPLEVGGIEQAVTVVGSVPLVDTTSKEIGGRVSEQEFMDFPSFNRNFAGYLGMMPGVVATINLNSFGADSISAAGQSIRNVAYTMDGSNNNDTFSGGASGAQARVPVEAVQEFQLLTSQFDAEYGVFSGGVVNAVSKQGTNAFHGSAFLFFQDEKLSALDYFAKQEGLEKPPTKQQQFGGTLGGPILRNRAHFFASLERVIIDPGVTINIPTRPDLNRTDFESTRVWNTFLRGDHQLTPSNTWGLRWLRETSPQAKQLNEVWTAARAEAETDIDSTIVANLSSVLGSTKVNTLRASTTSEDVFFGNPNFNENGHNQKILAPTLQFASFMDQQSPRANRRLDVAYAADDVFAWFVPNKGGDHDLKAGLNYLYSSFRLEEYGNMNGTFTFPTDRVFNAADPRSYPERLSVRVPGPVNFLMKGHFIGLFVQDKWKVKNRLTLSAGARYDVEILPTPNQQNPLYANDPQGFPRDNNNVQPRLGFAYAMDDNGRSAIRGGFGVFFQRTVYNLITPMFTNGRNSTSFTVNFPTNNADPGPRAGNFPSDPRLSGGPVVNQAVLDSLFPPGTRIRNVGTVRFDNPDRQIPWSRQYSIGYERQIGPGLAVSLDVIHAEQRAQYLLKDLNPGLRATTTATSTLARNNPLVGTVGEFAARVDTIVNEGEMDYNTFQVSVTKRPSRGLMMRASYAYSHGKGNTAGENEVIASQLLGDMRLDTEMGPTNVDRPHVMSVSGTYDIPRTGGLKVSAVLQARSGSPFSLINSTFDQDRNGSTANEYLPAGTYSGNGADAFTVDYKGGRNGARGPKYMNLDLRGGYRFRMKGNRTLDAFIDVFNVTNEPNFANPLGDRRVGTFLLLTTIFNGGPTRTAQLNMRFGF
jgi:hypothetical protein